MEFLVYILYHFLSAPIEQILKNGYKQWAYKKYRYYPFLYKYIGGFLRVLNKTKLGNFIIENTFVVLHFLMYKIFRKQRLSIKETRNLFYDYFITPIATFQSKKDVDLWISDSKCTLEKYDRTNGNCHVFIIKKGE